MRNLFKKSALFLALFLFACKVHQDDKTTARKPVVAPQEQEVLAPKANFDFLETRDLNVLNSHKEKTKIALFLPFSGKNKELGWHLYNSAVLSLFDNDLNNNLELVLIDSGETPQEAAKAFKEVVKQNIKIVVGPVFSTSVEAIEQDVKDNNIVAISLSNNPKLVNKTTQQGGIFLAGIMPEAQIEKIVTYAIDQQKASFAVIAPNNQYGLIMTDLLKKTAKRKDAEFITSEFYEANAKDFKGIAQRIVSAFKVPSHLAQGNKPKKDLALKDSDRIYPKIIFIPESGKLLPKILEEIKAANTDEREFQIVGSSQWDDVSTLTDPNLVGAWISAPENNKFHTFEQSYFQTYNKFPPRITSIVYDSVAVISDLVEKKQGVKLEISDFTAYSTWPKNGFQGIDGLFRFLPNGLVQRNLAMLQVKKDRFETIDNPIEKFPRY
jgi:branched-chain amino acid transport system substrate-binding protein